MKAKNEIERWLKDEKFMAFANKRAKEEFFNSENNYIDPQYEEMAEGFEDNDEYVVGKSSVSCPLKPSDSAPLC